MDTEYFKLSTSLNPATLQNLHLLTTTNTEYNDLVKFCDDEQVVSHDYTIAALFDIVDLQKQGLSFKQTQELVTSFLGICDNYRLLALPKYGSVESEVKSLLHDKISHQQIDNNLKKLLKLLEQFIENELLLRLNAVKLGEDTATGFKLCYDNLKSQRTDKTSVLYEELLTYYKSLRRTLRRYIGTDYSDLLDINKLHMLMSYYKKATDMIRTILGKLLDLLESFNTGDVDVQHYDPLIYIQLENELNSLTRRINSALLSIALAIATPCLSPPDRLPTGDSASISLEVKPISLINLFASFICSFSLINPKGYLNSFPIKIFQTMDC